MHISIAGAGCASTSRTAPHLPAHALAALQVGGRCRFQPPQPPAPGSVGGAHLCVRLQRAVGVALAPAHLNQGGAQPAIHLALGCHRIVPHLGGRRARGGQLAVGTACSTWHAYAALVPAATGTGAELQASLPAQHYQHGACRRFLPRPHLQRPVHQRSSERCPHGRCVCEDSGGQPRAALRGGSLQAAGAASTRWSAAKSRSACLLQAACSARVGSCCEQQGCWPRHESITVQGKCLPLTRIQS